MPVFNISFDVSKLKSGASEATDALSGVNSEAKKVENELDKVADSGKTSGEGLKKTSSGAKEASDSFSSLSKTVKTAGGHFAAFFAIDKMVAIGKELLNVSIAVDRLNKSYQSIEGSSGGAKEQLEFIYKTSQDLGLSFMSTAESAKTFFASAKGTSLEKDMNKIFTSVSQAGTAMSLSSEQMQGVFLALGQMISKGKVQAEELRGQLGERLPGAFRIAADAMGMTIAELDKFMADGELTAEDLLPKLADALTNKFAVAAEQAATGVQQSINKMDNEWTVFKANLLDSEPVVSAINMITSALQGLNAQIGQRDLEKRMEAAGWERTEKTDFRKSTYKLYTDEQKEAFLEYEKMLRDQEKAEAEVTNNQKVEIDKRTKAASDANAAYEKIFSTTKKGQINAANEAYSTAAKLQKDALDKGAITQAEYDSRITALAQARDDKLTAINKRGSKTRLSEVEREAKKFTEATAQYDAGLKQLRNEVSAMEDALDPSLTKFERLRKQIEAEEKAAKGNADVKSEETVRRKQATAAQAQETAALEKRKATLTATQKLDELENQNLKEKADFYKDLANKTGRYSTSMEYQNQLLEKQREIWLGMGIPVNDVQEMIRQLQLESSRDPFDGITRGLQGFISKATDGAKAMEDTFSGLFNGMDSGFKDVWQQMLDDGKVSLSSFKSLFASFLADLMHMAITRPIVVQIAGVVSGMLGAGGVGASGSGYGSLLGNVPVSSLIPNSWTSGVSGILGATLPGTSLALTTPGAYTAGEILLMQGGGTTAGVSGGSAALMSSGLSLGSALMYGGLGLLGYSMLDDALGLPQSKYSGLTAGLGGALGAWGGTAAGSAAGIAAGSTLGSVIPVAGTIIGAIAGGALGSLFGQERKTHPSVYGSMMGQGYTTDAQSYIDAFMEQATYDRAGKTEASAYAQVIGEAASQTAGNIINLAAMLPDEYKKSVEDQLESATWSAGSGFSGASWNLQNWKEGMAEERIQEAVDDMFEQMGYGANKAFAEAGIGELFTTFDLSTEEGFKKAQTAISAISSITTAIDEINAPTSEAEQQAKAFVAQMDALGEAVKASGLNAAYADKMIGEYRTAYVDNYVNALEEMFNPLSQIEQQAKGYKEAIDGYVSALTTMGASEAQLAQVRGYTQNAIDSITGSLDAAFFPLSDVETQTKATMESLTAYGNALTRLGATADELAKVDEARAKAQADLLAQAHAYVNATPEIISQANAMNAEFDALRQAMIEAGNATADLTALEQDRAQAVAAMQAEYVRSFDQGLAQRYATLNGTSDAVSRAISQENELREAVTKFGEGSAQVSQLLHIQAAENVAAAQAAVDSLQGQLNQLKQQAIQAEISAINEQLSAAKTLKDAWESLSDSLRDSRAKLWTSDADALGLFARRDTAQSEFDRLYSLTMSGDKEAAAELASSGDTLLSLLKETSANGEQYTAGFWEVEQKLKDAESVAGKQLSEAQKSYNTLESQLKSQQAMLDALGYNNNSLDAINAQIVTVGNQLAKALGDLNAAQSNPNYGGTNSGGGYVSWEDKILAEKTASLNKGEFLQPGAPTSWTDEQTKQAMIDTYGSIKNWYNAIGKTEGFATGGLTPPNEMFSAGEAGKEYMLSPSQYVVLNNSMTRKLDEMQGLSRQMRQPVIDYRLMQMPAVGTDGETTAELVKLREEVSELKNILRQQLDTQRGTAANVKNTSDSVENMVRSGIRMRQ